MQFKKIKPFFLIYMLFALITLFKVFYFNALTNLGFNLYTLLSTIGLIFICAFAISFLNIKHQIIILQILQILISIVLFLDLTYYSYFKDFLSIFSIENIKNITAVSSSVENILNLKCLVIFFDVVLYIIFYYLDKNKKVEIKTQEYKYTEFTTTLFILSLIGIAFIYSSIYSIKKLDKYALQYLYDKKFIASKSNVLIYHIYDIRKFMNFNNNNIYISDENIAQAEHHVKQNKLKNDEFLGKYKGKNLIVIQLESAQGFVLNKKIDGQEITPNLNKLITENYFVPNFYYQTSVGGTSDAEFAVNTGLIPLSDVPVYYSYANKINTTLPKLFKKQGYFNYAMHGNDGGFWNRKSVYMNLGFDDFYDISDYDYNEKIMLGLSDESFFKQNIEKIKNMQKPFYSFIITLSTHHPYNDEKFKNELNVGTFEGTLMGNYLKAMHYLDRQVGMFLDELDKEGILDDSVVILYGDHHGIPYANKNEIEKFLNIKINNEFDWYKLQKTFAIIKTPDSSLKGTNYVITGQSDLFPTIVHLFGLDATEFLGNSIIQKDKNEIVTPYGLYIFDDYMYISYIGKIKRLSNNQNANNDIVKKYVEDYNNIIKYNNIFIKFSKK